MADTWGASAAELTETMVPIGFSPSSQPSAVAVSAAHADVAAFTTELATRVDMRAGHVIDAHASYITGEADSANALATLCDPPTIV
jgi:hypothetical protein